MNVKEIRIEDYNYQLDDSRIAKYPLAERDTSNLLYWNKGKIEKYKFFNLPELLDKEDLLIYNNTDDKGHSVTLDGSNVRSSNLIVATAIIDEVKTTDSWTFFNIPFTYTTEIDPAVLAKHGYNLAVVFTSSFKGADFQGAVGR